MEWWLDNGKYNKSFILTIALPFTIYTRITLQELVVGRVSFLLDTSNILATPKLYSLAEKESTKMPSKDNGFGGIFLSLIFISITWNDWMFFQQIPLSS